MNIVYDQMLKIMIKNDECSEKYTSDSKLSSYDHINY